MPIRTVRRRSIGYLLLSQPVNLTLLSIAASRIQRVNLAIRELDGPTQAANKSTQLDGVQTPKRSMTSLEESPSRACLI